MATSFPFLRTPAASAALALAAAAAAAQTATLPPVSVTGRGDPQVGIAGWGDLPLSRAPFSASVVTTEQMRDRGVQRLSDLVRLDPGVSDDYNAEGYWDSLSVRGYEIENHTNHYRDGLPINAETRIPLDNKERVEVLKGTSGLQAGVSAPGGLVNFVVKRPMEQPLREARLAWQQSGSVLAAVDLSQRFGEDRVFGLRVNAATERLAPRVRDADGHRTLFALAGDWRLAPDTLLEAEVETSHRSQPSVPGFSLLGNAVPDPRTIDPRISLNNQPWSLPVVFDGHAASLRFSQRLSEQWRWTAHVATQQLRSDDRVAFPFGCSAEGNFDRFCSDGTYDLYDFRSDDEHRRTDALELALHGRFETGAVAHSASAGVLRSRFTARFQGQAFNLVGIGNIQGTLVTPPDPTLGPGNADRDEDSTELFARDAARLGDVATAWFGVRHSRLSRRAGDTRYAQSFTVPFAALSHDVGEGQVVYASWGQGVETAVTPGLAAYGTQAGQPLPALKSRQVEVGAKGRLGEGSWSAAAFDIERPATTDALDPDGVTHRFFIDGTAHHRGVEAAVAWPMARWTFEGGVQILHARREDSTDPSLNGKRPTNVPAATLKLGARHDVAGTPGLSLQADLLAVSNRMVLPDNSARIPGYARVDASMRYVHAAAAGTTLTWRAGVDNLLDRRAWKESPYEFGHAYLFPLPPRTFRLSVEAAL